MAIKGLNPITTTFEGGVRGILDGKDFKLLSIEDENGGLISATDISNYPNLERSIATLQSNSPIQDDENINVNISIDGLRTKFTNDRLQSNSNIETDDVVNSVTISFSTPASSDFGEATQDREFGNLIYPIDANYNENGQDHLYIEQFTYTPPREGIVQNQTVAGVFEGGIERLSPIEEIKGSVRLPIPDGISDTNTVNWNGAAMGPMAGAALAGATQIANSAVETANKLANAEGGINKLNAIGESLTSGASGLGDQIKRLGNSPIAREVLTRQLIATGINALGVNLSAEEILAASSGRITNQNLELLFSSMNLRQFSFAFQLAPRSQQESIEVRKIIRFFKQGSSPKKSALGENNSAFYVKTPNVFRLSYRRGDSQIKSLNKFKVCALQSVNVGYAPNGYATFMTDSQPVNITMGLSFTELTPIFYDDYEDLPDHLGLTNFDVDDVGF
mgnify:CR=1 FL=1